MFQIDCATKTKSVSGSGGPHWESLHTELPSP